MILILIPLVLIYEEPNLSTTICTAALFCMLMYVGGLSYKFIAWCSLSPCLWPSSC